MGNKWFNGVFVPSLFERAGVNHLMWLSAKQTQICVENFDSCKTVKVESECGMFYRRNIYKHTWNNRIIHLYYSKLNGCSQIIFGYTPEEIEQNRIENEKTAKIKHIERLEHLKKRALIDKSETAIEHYNKRIERLRKDLQSWKIELQEDIEDGEPVENIEFDKKKIAEIKADLDFLLN